MSLGPITDVDDLRDYLRVALQLEHATIPPYLTALYSIHPVTNADASRILRVVAVEEMLHLTLVPTSSTPSAASPTSPPPGSCRTTRRTCPTARPTSR